MVMIGLLLRGTGSVSREVVLNLQALLKRGLDVCAAIAALLFLAPLMALVAFALFIDSPGPILFGHTRVGRNGTLFRCWKFRTMVVDAESALQRYLASHPEAAEEWRERRKLKQDPRCTRIGRFLRKSSIDELPQLFNVLRGDMSLVGPRPVTVSELEMYGEAGVYYLSVRPGITGLWQVSGRDNVSYEHRVRLDSLYVQRWTLAKDLTILMRTIPAVLRSSDAS